MEIICTNCHAVLAADQKPDWCPGCGGALVQRPELPETENLAAPAEIDHRGIVMPRRHAVGGIITPR